MSARPDPGAVLRHLRSRLRGEIFVFGLRREARIEVHDGTPRLFAMDADDGLLAEGYLAASTCMIAFDLQRRLWSGRLAELLGERLLAEDISASDLDHFVRLLDPRGAAERTWRELPTAERAGLRAYAAGVNAWIDARPEQAPGYARLRSRPRHWSPVDALLLREAEDRLDGLPAEPILLTEAARTAGWLPCWTDAIRARIALLRSDRLRAPGSLGGGFRLRFVRSVEGREEGLEGRAGCPLRPRDPPLSSLPSLELHAEVPLPEDARRIRSEAPRGWERLRLRRCDIALRGGGSLHRELRWAHGAPVVSDLFVPSASSRCPPPFSLRWSAALPGTTPRRRRAPLPTNDPWRFVPPNAEAPIHGTIHLIPLRERGED